MEKVESLNLKLLPLAALLIITPLLSTSLRFKYLYFIVNILIIALGAEAGLLSFFLQSQHNPKPPPSFPTSLPHKPPITPHDDGDDDGDDDDGGDAVDGKPAEEVAQSPSEKTSIFYIHDDHLVEDDDDQLMEDDDVEDHELFHKAETFIGNFYKQLKMQRQESWNN